MDVELTKNQKIGVGVGVGLGAALAVVLLRRRAASASSDVEARPGEPSFTPLVTAPNARSLPSDVSFTPTPSQVITVAPIEVTPTRGARTTRRPSTPTHLSVTTGDATIISGGAETTAPRSYVIDFQAYGLGWSDQGGATDPVLTPLGHTPTYLHSWTLGAQDRQIYNAGFASGLALRTNYPHRNYELPPTPAWAVLPTGDPLPDAWARGHQAGWGSV